VGLAELNMSLAKALSLRGHLPGQHLIPEPFVDVLSIVPSSAEIMVSCPHHHISQ
jgi:hypothetical protein